MTDKIIQWLISNNVELVVDGKTAPTARAAPIIQSADRPARLALLGGAG